MSQKDQNNRTLMKSIEKKLTSILRNDRHEESATEAASAIAPHAPQPSDDGAKVLQWPVPYAEIEPSSDRQRELQDRLRSYVISHISDPLLNVVDMAKDLHVSRTSLFIMMHEAFDTTPIAYITEKRMAYALDLLQLAQKVSVVAARCGYSDPKYFGKVFKHRFGILPSKLYRMKKQELDPRPRR